MHYEGVELIAHAPGVSHGEHLRLQFARPPGRGDSPIA